VDLPEPEGPTIETNSPGRDRKRDSPHRGDRNAASHVDLGQFFGKNDGRRRICLHPPIVIGRQADQMLTEDKRTGPIGFHWLHVLRPRPAGFPFLF